jgi:hypothetical protein
MANERYIEKLEKIIDKESDANNKKLTSSARDMLKTPIIESLDNSNSNTDSWWTQVESSIGMIIGDLEPDDNLGGQFTSWSVIRAFHALYSRIFPYSRP